MAPYLPTWLFKIAIRIYYSRLIKNKKIAIRIYDSKLIIKKRKCNSHLSDKTYPLKKTAIETIFVPSATDQLYLRNDIVTASYLKKWLLKKRISNIALKEISKSQFARIYDSKLILKKIAIRIYDSKLIIKKKSQFATI